ncbi:MULTISPECIES: flagellar basal body rod protein FlgB [Photorhabdus]|uniref:Flagellar basal body rod protein FlgB n=1 Tax=Photorhabdus thracensis TaxID=230089 RepID=A0A0F7LUH2_9GAMM|nr:flagellar basal body rod protein FlgB [Photorhabdus thracensis]AKH65548.1 flagellar biosynthesis protein FlgB [Photorhabdus thracensis]MCC8421689.1 flagellar basal body rod protein FlgB [Photorhabdus thracensis]
MLDKLDAAFHFQQEALSLRSRRQEILSANIANADTPGYQARDIDFATQLKKTIAHGRVTGNGIGLTLTSDRHIPIQPQKRMEMDLLYRVPYQAAMDGNTVDMDMERGNFMDNSLKYQAELTATSSQVKSMMAVLQQG